MEGVQRFVYLGSQLDSANGSRTEQLRRIGIAASTMSRLSRVWHQSHLTLTTRLRLYMSLVVPVLLYGSETWTTTKADIARLQAFHMRCQRRILGVHWYDHITNVAIASQTRLPHIANIIAQRRYSLFGHVVRLPALTPGNMALKLCRDVSVGRRIPSNWKRPRGRPRLTWISQFKADTGVPVATSWSRALDRRVWSVGATALRGYLVQ